MVIGIKELVKSIYDGSLYKETQSVFHTFGKNFEGKPIRLNTVLIKKQKLEDTNIARIVELHQLKDETLSKMANTPASDKKMLRSLARKVTKIERGLQEAWKFPVDDNWHKWWYLPHCACPKMDNDDNYPTGHYTQTINCPIHGSTKRVKV